MKKLLKYIAISVTAITLLTGCAKTAQTKKLEIAPFYKMLEDTVFVNKDGATEKSFTMHKGQSVVAEINADNELTIYMDGIPYTTTSKNIEGVEEMRNEPMVMMISAFKIEIHANAEIFNSDLEVIATANTALTPVYYVTGRQVDGEDYYQMAFGGNLALIKTTDATLEVPEA